MFIHPRHSVRFLRPITLSLPSQAATLAQWQKLGTDQIKNRALTQLARQTERVASLAKAPAPAAAKLAAVAAPGFAMALVRSGYDFRMPASK